MQSVVALSTIGAEFIAMTKAIKEGMWLLEVAEEMGAKQENAVIHYDNQSTVHMSKHQVFNERLIQIDIKLHVVS